MRSIHRHSRTLLLAVCCVALGAGASAVAGAGAATGAHAHQRDRAATRHAGHHGAWLRGRRMGGLARMLRRTVHGDFVVHTKTGFATVTFDRGTLQSVSGSTLTITEGTAKATYRTVTLTVPANVRVRDDRQRGTLSDLKMGQRVLVLIAPQRALVVAHTPRAAGAG